MSHAGRDSAQQPSRRNEKGRERNRGAKSSPGQGKSGQGRADQRRSDQGGGTGGRRFSAAAPAQRKRRADPARLTAYTVLRAVSRDDAYANLTLPAEIRRRRLDKRDAGFATELTYGTLRGTGTYDAILSACVDRPLDQLDAPVLDALRLGAHQLLNMRVETHAAVDETVALVRAEIGAGPSGLVNAVLRKVSARTLQDWTRTLSAERDLSGDDALALTHAHPAWVVRALRQSLRADGRGDELEALLRANNAAPEVHLVELPGTSSVEGDRLRSAQEAGAVASSALTGAAIFRGGDIARLPGTREGQLRVQDIGSQWVTRALAAAELPDPGQGAERWLDLCAGPGGKAALLAALAAQRGATVLANEPAAHRAKLVSQALQAVDHQAWTVRTGDGRTIGEEPTGTGFQRILVDAPCTGLGALRRRPEARWRRTPGDLAGLTALQHELLDAAVGALAPGGLLAYVTCSPHMAETVIQVDDLLRRHPELELLDAHGPMRAAAEDAGAQLLRDAPAGAGSQTAARCLQLWPHIHGTDAMFFALLQRPVDAKDASASHQSQKSDQPQDSDDVAEHPGGRIAL
ncbi:RsmB/NOP family class I SAM-dependent RNA methyltransferase [Nesterenkonia sandarakina]|uniref:16S rRNA (Cytosine967-C5)-methyltransferase n=1 Tax=Nesterenkonia sandarakina TaxID=272918 RepID=A0A7Z0E9A9_9MICC|nr:transcription antitermination factor NusB [Nesterenkonia sandarakina]NYJ17326.1 16S rRNA (cytosine967-C5)-methyltransferase [Nesterenkonia sandarakina]